MASAARNCLDWTKKKATIVLRFLGTSPKSSNLIALLSTVTTQIRKAYGMNTPVSKDLQTLTDEFQISLFMASTEQPLVLILDSLDMLDPSYNARQLHWLPTRLRPSVKIIVSTLPEPEFEAFPALKASMKTQENFIQVPTLNSTDLSDIIDKWLELRHRRLTLDQKKILLTACNKCPLPLFMKLSFDKAVMWTSFVSGNSTVLEPTIRQCIDALFQRLEKMHGQIFVSRALGYLTAAKSGLTETELEDILSCDDDVLNDVYMYWTPPIRRLPPLLLVRLRADLDQYLADRGANGVRVMNWYHRQFIESAQLRYCSDEAHNEKLHVALADFFSGTWANGKQKPYTSPDGQKESADRHVADQSNKFGTSYNLRKLNNLPYHRCLAGQVEALKDECLCNVQFLLDKLNATTLWKVMDDFAMAKQHFPNDELLVSINDTLQLAQAGLLYDPNQLIPQMLGRLPKNKSTKPFLDKCETVPVPSLIPDKSILTQPGGQLIHSMAGHKGDILSLDLTEDSKTALTCSDDGSIRVWSVVNGQQIQCFDGLGKVSRARFCYNDKYILIDMNKKLTIRGARTGEKIHDINSVHDDYPSCLCGDHRSLLVVFKQHSALVYKLNDVSLQFSLECSDEFEFLHPGIAFGSKNYAAVTTSDQIYMTVLDLKKQKFSPLFRGFEPFNDPELGDDINYEIDDLIITLDEKYIIYSNIYTNDIVFLDFHAKKKTNIIKGNPNDYMRSLKESRDGKSLYFVKGPNVNFYDLKSSKTSVELKHNVDIIAACTNDMKTIVTTSEDSNVRIWDRTKTPQQSPSAASSAHKIRMLRMLSNSRYVVGFGFKTSDMASQILFVYDVIKHVIVKQRSLDCSILHMELLNDKELVVVHDVIQKMKVINIETLTVTREFQGYLPSRKVAFTVIRKRGEVACLSFGRHNVKLYNILTGKVSTVLETRQQGKLDGICVSKNEQTLVAWCDDASLLFTFDLSQKKLLHKIQPDMTAMLDEDQITTTFDGKFVMFKVEGVPAKSKKEEDTVYLEVWDVHKGKKVIEILDIEYYHKYLIDKNSTEMSAAVDTFVMLDDNNVLVAHDDYILRVFEVKTGKLLHRLFGHTTGTEIVFSPENPFIVTFGSWTEEMSIRLWNKQDFTCIASFTLDETITNLQYSTDNKFILATTGTPVEIVTWKLQNYKQGGDVTETQYLETFKGIDTKGDLDLVPEDEELHLDPNDPDKDMEAQSSDDDDDFV